MNDKKQTVKRLLIYIALSYIPLIILTVIFNSLNGGPIYEHMSEEIANGALNPYVQASSLGMYFPAIAALITRLITKEGFKDSRLELTFKGNAKYYFLSCILPIVYSVCEIIVVLIISGNGRSFFNTSDINAKIYLYLNQVIVSVLCFMPAFGEEWGWRGYMMPKLLKIMPKGAALIAGGIIWGLWHAPLTISGHNFGLDYPGAPWTGIILMCVFCVLLNIILTYLTEKTSSIYPASFCHMINNNAGAGTIIAIFADSGSSSGNGGIVKSFLIQMIPVFCFAAVFFVLFLKNDKRKRLL